MVKVNEIAFSCYPVTDMARARKFYEDVLGLKPAMVFGEPGDTQWTEYEVAGGTIALCGGSPDWMPAASGGSVTLEVENFDEAIAHLATQGVKFKTDPFETPVCHMAFIFDPEGNLVGIHRRKAK